MKRQNVAGLICGIGFGILVVGGCGLDFADMTRPVILCVIGLILMMISIPFLQGERESEEDSVIDSDSSYSRNYPYDKHFRRR